MGVTLVTLTKAPWKKYPTFPSFWPPQGKAPAKRRKGPFRPGTPGHPSGERDQNPWRHDPGRSNPQGSRWNQRRSNPGRPHNHCRDRTRQIRPEGFKITFPRSAMWPTGSRSIFSAYPSTAPTKWTSSYALYVVLKPEPSKQRASCNALLRRLTGKRWVFQAITNKVSGSLPASKLF